jgi:prophage regulatory protein
MGFLHGARPLPQPALAGFFMSIGGQMKAKLHPQASATRLMRLPEVREKIGLCRSTIYARVAQGTFPPPVSLGARAVAWPSHEIDAWIAERIAEGSK